MQMACANVSYSDFIFSQLTVSSNIVPPIKVIYLMNVILIYSKYGLQSYGTEFRIILYKDFLKLYKEALSS